MSAYNARTYTYTHPSVFDLTECDESKESYELCSVSKSGNASEPSCVLDQEPDDMQLELHYDGTSPSYVVKLTWPSLQGVLTFNHDTHYIFTTFYISTSQCPRSASRVTMYSTTMETSLTRL